MSANPTNAAAVATRTPKPGKKYFTLAEANRAVPYVARVVDDLVVCHGRVTELRRRIENPEADENREHLEADYETSMERLGTLMAELEHVGVELKDFEKGLLDFPAVHDGREIYLCWHRGEKSVGNWHETDAGFNGRKSVETLKA